MRSERLTTVIKFIKKGEKIMKRSLSLILALAMTLTLLAGCGNKAKNNDPGSSGEKEMLTIAVNEDISGLDPFAQNTSLQNTYTILMYDSLLALDPATGEIVPGLAESYDIVSATEYVFHLRSGVKFHNGEDLKASDVKFSLERAAASTGMASKVSQIDRIEVEDDSTVRIFLNVPSTTILNNLAFCGTSIMCEEWCNANQGSFKHNGTGPYVFREWNSGESIIFDRNDNYWGDKGAMKTLKFVVMNEANSRTIALETGEIDVNAFPAAIDLARFESDANINVYSVPSTQVHFLSLNYKMEPTSNVNVRKAIACAINKQDMISVTQEGRATPMTTILGAGQQYSDTSIPGYDYDLEKAKEYLAAAGYPNGFDLTISCRTGGVKNAEVIQSQLGLIGINVKIDQMENAAFVDLAMSEKMQAACASWQPATSDADNPLRNLLYSKSKGSSNESRYNNPAFDAVLDEALQETDPEKAQELYSKAQMFIYEDVPVIPLYSPNWTIAANAHVKNVVIPVVGDAMFYKNMQWEA